MSLVTVIIPTFNNREYLEPCVRSLMTRQTTLGIFDLIIVNNGDKDSIHSDFNSHGIKIIHAGKNLGWEGGLKEGLKHVKTPYAVFLNDDTYIPYSSAGWLYEMIMSFEDPLVAAVGPSSNCVMGLQNIFVPTPDIPNLEVNMLIGFCLMVRMEALEKVGGIDDSYPHHGDDIDLSIRLREAGYKLIANKRAFVYHHGFKTGQREHGSAWNSIQMTEKTNEWLIRKHGLKTFMKYVFHPLAKDLDWHPQTEDTEGEICRRFATGKIMEMGCGALKTVPDSVGVDIVPKGELIPGLINKFSVADRAVDVCEPLPFEPASFDTVICRHILEHVIDPIKALKDWVKVVRPGGRIIFAVPDQGLRETIPLNYQHVHAFTHDSLKNLMETLGWHTEHIEDAKNGISFVGVFNKNGAQ